MQSARTGIILARTYPRILIIGLGQIGYSNAEYMARRGLSVDGYDVEHKAVERAISDRVIDREATTFEGYDYYVICISTHKTGNISSPSFDGISHIARRLSEEGKTGALVSIESTVTKGTTDNVNQVLDHRLHVAHLPHRFYAKEKEEHGVNQVRVLGGCRECCIQEAIFFYRDLLGIPLHLVSSVELAELSKIAENAYRFLEIAFAEELKMLCDAYALEYKQLRDAMNSKWNIKILEAQRGIDGHCLPKDTEMYLDLLSHAVKPNIVEAAKRTDHLYKLSLAQRVSPKMGIPMRKETSQKIGMRKVALEAP